MATDIYSKEKESFVAELQKAGWHTTDDHGVVMVAVPSAKYEEAQKNVKEIVKIAKYDLSYGIKKD